MEKNPPHPGEVLMAKFLTPLGVTQAALARHIRVSEKTVNEIVHGKRAVTPHSAWLLAQAFGTEPEYWLHLQAAWSLAKSQPKRRIAKLEKSVTQPTLFSLGSGS
jgi:addiction module HigA family antidote